MSQILESPTLADSAPRWTVEQVTRLDWKRIVEIMRALSAATGFTLGKTRVDADGTAEFVIANGPQRVLVRLAPWNRWMAGLECLTRFSERLHLHANHRGIYLAPEGFDQSALHAARLSGIETVDADALVKRLNKLPAEHRDFYFDIATAGDATTPSCPVCIRPLILVEESSAQEFDPRKLPDLRYATSDIVAGPVHARRIEVMKRSEVQFLQEVRAGDVEVHGVVTGDFLCEGKLALHPGATLYGSVAARSIIVSPGAQLIGETRILADKPESFGRTTLHRVWRCRSSQNTPGCAAVALDPHS